MRVIVLFLLAFFSMTSGESMTTRQALLLFTSDADTTQRWGVYRGMNGNPFASAIPGRARIRTFGTGSDITASVPGSSPFQGVVVDDVLQFVTPVNRATGTITSVLISSKGGDDDVSISPFTVNLDISGGVSFRYLKSGEGTTSESGWINVGADAKKTWSWTGSPNLFDDLVITIQCRDGYPGAPSVQVYPNNPSGFSGACYTGTIGVGTIENCKFMTEAPYQSCRWGFVSAGIGLGIDNNSITAGYVGGSD